MKVYKKIEVKSTTLEDWKTLMALALSKGFTYHGQDTLEGICEEFPFSTYPCNVFHLTPKHIGGNFSFYDRTDNFTLPQDYSKVLNIFFGFEEIDPIIVHDVGDYEATITAKAIEVGCQTITHEKFDEIVAAVKTVRGVEYL